MFNWKIIMLVAFTGMAAGCRSGNQEKRTLIDNVEEVDESATIESFNQVYHLYPSPGEMLGIIDVEELSYEGSLLIPSENADSYMDSRAQTYVLGAYMTDLAYAALFGRHEVTLDYLEVVGKLSMEIRVDEAIQQEMIEQARASVEYLDSLYYLSNEAFMNILAYCEQEQRSNTLVMLSAGAFIESLYLGVNLVAHYENAGAMLKHLSEQKFTIDKFVAFAEGINREDPNVVTTISDLKRIQGIYDGMGTRPDLSREQLEKLKMVVMELREKVVTG